MVVARLASWSRFSRAAVNSEFSLRSPKLAASPICLATSGMPTSMISVSCSWRWRMPWSEE